MEEQLWVVDCNAALVVGHRVLQAEGSVACAMAAAAANLAPADSIVISTSSASSSSASGSERGSISDTSSTSLGSCPVANEAVAGGKGSGYVVQPAHRSNLGSRSSPASSPWPQEC